MLPRSDRRAAATQSKELPAKIFSDAEAIYTYEGSYEINTLIVGRAVTGVSAIV